MPRDAGISRWLKFAIGQGIAGPLLFAAATVGGGLAQPGYSHVSNAISELTASGAPKVVSRNWWKFEGGVISG